jgi:cytochrome d ubiquinol oxidase subunit I
MIQQAVDSTVPRVAPMFWSFRVMVALGFMFALLLGLSFYHTVRGTFLKQRWLLRWALWFIPMPWIAAELGWFVAEYGRQPWTIYGVLPTHLSASSLSVGNLYGSLAGFIVFYTGLLVIEMYLMVKFARKGPGSLGTGRYHSEQIATATI